MITGGASSVYGSDAIAGVVNIILKDDFEGMSLEVMEGGYDAGDGDTKLASLTFGAHLLMEEVLQSLTSEQMNKDQFLQETERLIQVRILLLRLVLRSRLRCSL